jgi:LysM domain
MATVHAGVIERGTQRGSGVSARHLAGCIVAAVAVAGCTPLAGQQYVTVTVAPWNSVSPPWNSTLWGIATHYHVSGGYQALAQINGITDPALIRPGELIKVPA